jgi:hypothetical protein
VGLPALRVVLPLLLAAAVAGAQQPTLNHLYPVAGQAGTTVPITALGKFAQWPPQVWVDAPGITFKPAPKAPAFEVEIAPDAAPGPHFVRFYNEKGASGPRVFIVSPDPEVVEKEPNDRHSNAQKLSTLPATVSGRLEKAGDVDGYAVPLKKGQWLVAWMEAYVLASTFDGLLRVVDEAGTQHAFQHDGRTLDPFLAWQAPADGNYVVQATGFSYPPTSNVQFAGGEGCIYRLHLTAGPFVHHTVPLSLPRADPKPKKLVGWNLPSGDVSLAKVKLETAVPLSDVGEEVEREPHDPGQAVAVPGAITGLIARPNEEDRYTFTAARQRTYAIELSSLSRNSALIGWLKVEDAAGKEVARTEGAATSSDPKLLWKAPADGSFRVAIGDVTHRGSPDHFYRLAITEAVPRVEASIATSSFTVEPGKTAELKVAFKRLHGAKAKLELLAKNLPPGITAAALELPAKDGDATLKLVAEAAAAAANQPFQIVLRDTETQTETPVTSPLATTTSDNGVPGGYTTLLLPEIRDLWLTVLAAK